MLFGNRRLDDHIAEVRDDRLQARAEHREIRDAIVKVADRADAAIKDLSDQTRGEFKAIRDETDRRHAENRKFMKTLFAGIVAVVIGAALTAYIGAHGFRSPAISGDNVAATDAVKALKGMLQQILIEEKQPIRPGGG